MKNRFLHFILLIIIACLPQLVFAQYRPITPPTRQNPKPPKQTPKTGTLYITSTPSDVAVKIDGEYMGNTPLTLKNRKAGNYQIAFNAEGYETITKSVTVTAGKTATCSATLSKKQVQQPEVQQPAVQLPTSTATPVSSSSVQTITVNGVSFKMVQVEEGTFQMGSTTGDSGEKPVHQVTLSSFSIGETEVTQELWQAVMGTNPSYFKGNNRPVEYVSWDDCQTFISKLNQLTGKTFRLPTEAEWEFAARGGNKSKVYEYSGSNTLDDVAWYTSNSSGKTQPVATKAPNELGIYDMTGNVWEWCQDWYSGNYYSESVVNNPQGPSSGSGRVLRGGSWSDLAPFCRVALRDVNSPWSTSDYLGLRLALCSATLSKKQAQQPVVEQPTVTTATATPSPTTQTYTVNGVSFKMIPVAGGTFQMGSTTGYSSEQPVHQVTLSSFSIGETEVMQELWQAVMGSNPSSFKGNKLPVEKVSWNDCQTFITKLNQLTGKTFRLPTEAEWEYAARGGNQSKGYTYSGSNTIGDVAWYEDNSSDKTHEVAMNNPNELGIYDMSGNVWEWCQDWYDSYGSRSQTNPIGPSDGSYRVNRGGSWGDDASNCRVAGRGGFAPTGTYNGLGLRLAL